VAKEHGADLLAAQLAAGEREAHLGHAARHGEADRRARRVVVRVEPDDVGAARGQRARDERNVVVAGVRDDEDRPAAPGVLRPT
jgi:hypothetical protein